VKSSVELMGIGLESAKVASNRRRTLAAAFAYFVVAGIATVMLGPALPELSARWKVPDAQLGTLFVAAFTGQLCGAWFAVRKLRASLACGAACTALGCLGLAYAGFTMAHVALFCAGLGIGAGLTAGNVIVGTIDVDADQLAPGKLSPRSKLLALLNMCWGVGAITCPLLMHAALRFSRSGRTSVDGIRLFFLLLSAALASSAILTAVLLPRVTSPKTDSVGNDALLPAQTFAFFLAVLLIYVGIENGLGGWLPTYAQRTLSVSAGTDLAASIALCFWLSELGGRVLTAFVVNMVGEWLLYRVCVVMLIIATGVICLMPHVTTAAMFTLTFVSALSLAPMFPLLTSFLLARSGRQARLGPLFAMSALGGAIMPWLTGVLSTHYHALRVGFAVPTAGAILLLLLSVALPQGRRVRAA
jgi:FHS family glucose/mannose:H+ symporter-like MFS transporter